MGLRAVPWLGVLRGAGVRFVLRWPKRYHLADLTGSSRPAWQWARGKRAWAEERVWDARHRCEQRVGVWACEVRHPDDPGQRLWLVVGRHSGQREPWYLLTNEPAATVMAAWGVVQAYARRWQIEQTWRYCKSALSFESPRLGSWERRCKLLLLGSVAYAFLLSLLTEELEGFRGWLLRHGCHRTGERSRTTAAPLYRLRVAISYLWSECRPPPSVLFR